MELPTSPKRCLAIAMLRAIGINQKDTAKYTRCANQTVVDTEKWLREEHYHRVARICDDQSIKKMVAAEAIYWGLEEDNLVRLDRLTQDDILRHYRADYLETVDVAKEILEEHPEMRELAIRLLGEIILPPIWHTFIPGSKTKRFSSDRQGVTIETSEDNKIKVMLPIEGQGHITHLYQGLRSHLATGGFSDVLGEIDSWKKGVGQMWKKWDDLLKVAMGEIKGQVKIPDDKVERNERIGYQKDFFTSACANAVEVAKGNPPVTDSWYSCHPLTINNLWVLMRNNYGAIYVASNELGAKRCRSRHMRLSLRLSKTKQAEETAQLYKDLEGITDRIINRLQKFIYVKRVPGHCELCS